MSESLSERLNRALEDWKRGEAGRSISSFHRILAERQVQGSSYAMIHRYLRGQWKPSLRFLEAAAEVLGVRQQWLTYGEGPRNAAEAALPASRTVSVGLNAVVVTETEAKLLDLAGELGLAELHAVRHRLIASCRDGHQATPNEIDDLGDWLGKRVLEPLQRLESDLSERQGEDYVRAACHALMLAMPESRAGSTIGKLIERLED